MTCLDNYRDRFSCIRFTREDGVLELAIHRDGEEATWDALEGGLHRQLGDAFRDLSRDPENKVVILTGTGSAFLERMSGGDGESITAKFWDRIMQEGRDLLANLLDIPIPVIGALNGNAFIHAELVMLSDIVLAAESARIADKAHAVHGVVPSDGVHVVWPMLLGLNRGRHFLLTGSEIDADAALSLGLVAEVLPRDELRERSWTVARELAAKPPLMLRYARQSMLRELRRRLEADLGYGLALEGLAAIAMSEKPG